MNQWGNRILKITGILLISGMLFGLWWLYQQNRNHSVPILMYHRIGDEGNSVWWVHLVDFENHLKFLRQQGYKSILPSDLVAHRRWGKPLPQKPIIFTFDDGYQNSLLNAEPVLKKYGFRGIVYLVTGKVADTPAERKQMEGTPVLIWPEVKEMQKRGTLTFGGHTRSHANLAAINDPYPEIRGCFTDIKKKGGFIPAGFCYPNGEYHAKTLPDVKRAGFKTAVTCKGGFFETRHAGSFLELPRISVYGGKHIYHVETVATTNDASSITLKVWKEGCRVTSIPRLSTAKMAPEEGWLEPVRISEEPVTITWRLPKDKCAPPYSFELWGDMKLLPHWKQELLPATAIPQ